MSQSYFNENKKEIINYIYIISKPPVAEILIYEVCIGVRPMHIYLVKVPQRLEMPSKAMSQRPIYLSICVRVYVHVFFFLAAIHRRQNLGPPKRVRGWAFLPIKPEERGREGFGLGLASAHVDGAVDVPIYWVFQD